MGATWQSPARWGTFEPHAIDESGLPLDRLQAIVRSYAAARDRAVHASTRQIHRRAMSEMLDLCEKKSRLELDLGGPLPPLSDLVAELEGGE